MDILDFNVNINNKDDNLYILYITLFIVIGFLLLWVIIIWFTKEDPIYILNAMTNIKLQSTPGTDR